MEDSRMILPGSTRLGASGATLVGKTDATTEVLVTVVLKPKSVIDVAKVREHAMTLPQERKEIDRATFAAEHGADPAAVAAVEEFAARNGLTVVRVDPARRVVDLRGTVAQVEQAFGTVLHDFVKGSAKFRGRQGPVWLPASLAPHVEAVMGLDNRPVAAPRIVPLRALQTSYYPNQLAALYGFPAGDGTGQTVAVIELGGNYDPTDLATYFAAAGTPTPTLATVSVSPGVPVPYGQDQGSDGEVMLDVEVIGAIAPGAQIVVYFAENTDQGFYQALSQAVHDPATTAVSISWGSPEKSWSAQTMDAWETLAQSAALLNVGIYAAAGDHGCADEQQTDQGFDGQRHADFPGTAPHIVSCGGTHLESANGAITSETVWNSRDGWATGGGVSLHFPTPSWQSGLSAEPGVTLPMRGVPDVAGDADPSTGILVRVDGNDGVSGGTSAVAPLWSALAALLSQQLERKVGFFVPQIYANRGANASNDIVSGDNSVFNEQGFSAQPSWDACTGLGSPNGANLLQLFSTPAPALAGTGSV